MLLALLRVVSALRASVLGSVRACDGLVYWLFVRDGSSLRTLLLDRMADEFCLSEPALWRCCL